MLSIGCRYFFISTLENSFNTCVETTTLFSYINVAIFLLFQVHLWNKDKLINLCQGKLYLSFACSLSKFTFLVFIDKAVNLFNIFL